MKILMVNTLYYPDKVGGAEVSVQLLAEALSRAGHIVSVLAITSNSIPERYIVNGVIVNKMPICNIYWPFDNKKKPSWKNFVWNLIDLYNFKVKNYFREFLREIEPDIVHTNNLRGFSVSLWDVVKEFGLPLVHTSRDYYLLHPNTMLYGGHKVKYLSSTIANLLVSIKKKKSKKVDYYVGISKYIKDLHEFHGYFNPGHSAYIYNSVDIPITQREPQVTKLTKKFGYLGRIEPEKGLEVLLRAFSTLNDKSELLIAGSGSNDYINFLKSRYSQLNIIWAGYMSPNVFFNEVDLLIVPSLWPEPLGRVVLEAYTYGCPVIVAASGGLPEIVLEGETGFVYKASCHESLSSKLKSADHLCSMEFRNIRLNYVVNNFSAEIISQQYESSFEALLANRK